MVIEELIPWTTHTARFALAERGLWTDIRVLLYFIEAVSKTVLYSNSPGCIQPETTRTL